MWLFAQKGFIAVEFIVTLLLNGSFKMILKYYHLKTKS